MHPEGGCGKAICGRCGRYKYADVECGFCVADDREADRESVQDKTSREDKMERREDLRCSYCPPNRGENAGPYKKYGVKKKRKKGRAK